MTYLHGSVGIKHLKNNETRPPEAYHINKKKQDVPGNSPSNKNVAWAWTFVDSIYYVAKGFVDEKRARKRTILQGAGLCGLMRIASEDRWFLYYLAFVVCCNHSVTSPVMGIPAAGTVRRKVVVFKAAGA